MRHPLFLLLLVNIAGQAEIRYDIMAKKLATRFCSMNLLVDKIICMPQSKAGQARFEEEEKTRISVTTQRSQEIKIIKKRTNFIMKK